MSGTSKSSAPGQNGRQLRNCAFPRPIDVIESGTSGCEVAAPSAYAFCQTSLLLANLHGGEGAWGRERGQEVPKRDMKGGAGEVS
jgi:hypothetical protein